MKTYLISSVLQIVKFCQLGQDRVSLVSDIDIGIYQLQRSEKLLEERVQKLSLEADRLILDMNIPVWRLVLVLEVRITLVQESQMQRVRLGCLFNLISQ